MKARTWKYYVGSLIFWMGLASIHGGLVAASIGALLVALDFMEANP